MAKTVKQRSFPSFNGIKWGALWGAVTEFFDISDVLDLSRME